MEFRRTTDEEIVALKVQLEATQDFTANYARQEATITELRTQCTTDVDLLADSCRLVSSEGFVITAFRSRLASLEADLGNMAETA